MDFKQAREEKHLTLVQVAELSGYAIGTISDLENKGLGSDRLQQKLSEIYGLTSETSRLQEKPPEGDVEIWRRRAKLAEKELADLKANLRKLLSSDELSEVQQIAKRRGEKYDEGQPGTPSPAR